MIIPIITSSFTSTGIEVIDATPSDDILNSTNYSSGVVNTNYSRAQLDSVAFQVSINKCIKELIVKPEDVSDIYNITLANLGIETFQDAVYSIITCLLFDEGAGSVITTEGQTIIKLTDNSDKALLLANGVILIQNVLYDINTNAITDPDEIELSTPTVASGTFSFKHGYRKNTELLYLEGIRACLMKKIANIDCTCSKPTDTQTLYMNYKSIISNFELSNFGKTIDLISFANTVCLEPKIKNCACSC